jgi:CRISPR-associated endonuclease/helicase Cas3
VPDWAGTWRNIAVVVGGHQPPLPHEVPLLMRNYGDDLAARWEDARSSDNERLLEMLAFAEGRLLSIHPFRDFNGRVTRVFLREILRRLGVSGISLAPAEPAKRRLYLEALAAADRQDYRPLVNIWKNRVESAQLP